MQSRDTSIPIFCVPDESIAYQARPASYIVITDHQGRVAAVKGKTHYFLPGGGAIDQETSEQTVRREVMEELSREVHIIGQIGKAIQYFNADGRHYRMEAVYFAGEFGSESMAKGEHELCWLEVEQIEERFFHKSHVWAVRQASGTTFWLLSMTTPSEPITDPAPGKNLVFFTIGQAPDDGDRNNVPLQPST